MRHHVTIRYRIMAKPRRLYTWDHEPPPKRSGGSQFETTRGSEWNSTAHSTFSEPSRLDSGRKKSPSRKSPGQRKTGMIMMLSGASLLLCVALVAAARLMA
jgi:hypothetical protein